MAVGTYTTLVNTTSAGAKGEIATLFATLLSLIPDGVGPGVVSGNLPPNAGGTLGAVDFGQIHPDVAAKLRVELTAAALAVSAGA